VIAPQYWARFGNPYKRWASVANCYVGWQWQDIDGSLQSYEACLPGVTATEELYESTYNLRTTQGRVHKKPLRSLVPQPIRKVVKKTLGLIFPKWIG
jgi:choline dehydrogenase-like flavoprotein